MKFIESFAKDINLKNFCFQIQSKDLDWILQESTHTVTCFILFLNKQYQLHLVRDTTYNNRITIKLFQKDNLLACDDIDETKNPSSVYRTLFYDLKNKLLNKTKRELNEILESK